MRVLFTVATAIAFGAPTVVAAQAGAATAQPQAASAEKRDQGIPHHFDGITLTDEQKTKIRQLNHEYHTQINAVKVTSKKKDDVTGLTKPMPEQARKKLADLESQEMAAFRGVLTPDQQAIFDKNLAKEKADAAANAAKPGA
jgi:Spy/CpxP family protein refolding chaperone